MCGTEIFTEVYSPDNAYKAVVYERNCGATTGFTTNVSILPVADELPNRVGNVLQLDGHPDWTLVRPAWIDSDSLFITYDERYEVWSQNDTYRHFFTVIKVDYQ